MSESFAIGRSFELSRTNFFRKSIEVEAYSADMLESLHRLGRGESPVGRVDEIDKELRSKNPEMGLFAAPGFAVPFGELNRALSAGVFNTGGALVNSQQGPFDAIARPQHGILARANFLEGLNGNMHISRELSEVTFNWYTEGEQITLTDSSFGSFNPSPHRIGGATSVSNQLNTQAPLLSTILLNSMRQGLWDAMDYAAINGSGTDGEPMGLLKQTSVQTLTFSAAAAHADATRMVRLIAANDGDESSIAFVAHPNVRDKWQTIARFAGGSVAIWDKDSVADKPAHVSTNVPNTDIICGDWSRYFVCMFGVGAPLYVTIDPYTSGDTGRIRFIVQAFADCGTTRPTLFVKNSGSAVQ